MVFNNHNNCHKQNTPHLAYIFKVRLNQIEREEELKRRKKGRKKTTTITTTALLNNNINFSTLELELELIVHDGIQVKLGN